MNLMPKGRRSIGLASVLLVLFSHQAFAPYGANICVSSWRNWIEPPFVSVLAQGHLGVSNTVTFYAAASRPRRKWLDYSCNKTRQDDLGTVTVDTWNWIVTGNTDAQPASSNTSVASFINAGPGNGTITFTASGTYTIDGPTYQFTESGSASFLVLKVELEKCSSSFEPNGGDADNTTTIRAFVTPSGLQGKFKFTLTGVSSEPGYCLNMPKPAPGSGEDSDAWKDLQFPDQTGFTISGTDRDVAETTATDLNEATVTVKCSDYGAYGQIKAEFIPNGTGPSCTATEQGGSKECTNIPRDDDENHIWDGWAYSFGSAAQDADVNTGGSLWGDAGDGLTRYEEYRGLVKFTVHTRLNPTYKDVFVDNRDHYFSAASDFSSAASIQVQFVGDVYDSGRVINFNHETAHDVDQHVLVLVDMDLGGDWEWGEGFPSLGGTSPGDFDENRVDEAQIQDDCYYRDDEFVHVTVLHELCHGIGADHHIPPCGAPTYEYCMMRNHAYDGCDCQAAGSDHDAWYAITVGTTWLYKQETQQVSDNY